MLETRPNISYAVIKLSQFSANPSKEHLDRALYICRYLLSTPNYDLVFNGSSKEGLIAFSDSDWASDPVMCHSTTGYIIQLAHGPVSWLSHRQKTVALSSTKAEYMALSDCCRQVVWIRLLFEELGFKLSIIPICGDNQGSIFLSSNPVQERCTKYIDIYYHFIHECIKDGKVKAIHVDGDE